MRALVQRVTAAKVSVGDETISSIGKGLCVLIGISQTDSEKDADYLSNKLLALRLFEEDGKRWHKSVRDKQYEVLCVSQFTLCCQFKGNKPDFHLAKKEDEAKTLYEYFLQKLRVGYVESKIKDGMFGAYMQVHIQNDGPVTVDIESPKEYKNQTKLNKREPA